MSLRSASDRPRQPWVWWIQRWGALTVSAILPTCSPSPPTQSPPHPAAAPANAAARAPLATETGTLLYVPPSSYDFSRNPALLERILGSAHGYFRFVNSQFSSAVCTYFGDSVPGMPTVNLHGDAHLEQYAVTSRGRGLTDYEDSTSGPGIVDLARFGVSAYLACRDRGWYASRQGLLDRLLRGYRAALHDPALQAPEPQVVEGIRASFRRTREEFLAWAQSLMDPAAVDRAALLADISRYARRARSRRPELPSDFFAVKQVGAHHLGVGSALDEKYLFRIEGPTAAAADDLILELKEVRPATGASCVGVHSNLDPSRIALGRARISHQPFRYFGYVRRGSRMFWVHEWVEHYHELSVQRDLRSVEQLGEVVFDVGVQLGRGHPKQSAAAPERELRSRQLVVVDRHEPDLRRAVEELALATVRAWRRFRAEARVGARPTGPNSRR